NSYVYDPNPNSFDYPPDSYHPPHPTYKTYSYDSYGNDSQFGYDCQPQFPLQYESEQGYNENYPSQCLPMNQDSYNSNSLGFDQPQPPQSPANHPIFNAHNDPLISQTTLNEQMTQLKSTCEIFCQSVQKKREEQRIEEVQAAKAQTWKLPVCYDDDDDEERSDSLDDNTISGLPPFSAITPDEPVLSTEEPDNSLRRIKASNDNPIPSYDPIIPGNPPNLTPSEESDFFSEVDAFLAVEDEFTSSQFSKSYLDPEGDMLLFEAFLNDDHSSDSQTKSSSTSLNSLLEETNNFDNSLPEFTTFSNVLCDAECESDSSDDQSCSDEDVLEKIVSKPLSGEEIIPMESLRTHDSFLPISSKIDSLLDEFADELTLLKSIPPEIDESDFDFEEDIRLIEKLLYDNSSPRPPKEFISANSDAKIKSFSPSPILVKDSDSLMEEIDLFCTPDYPMSRAIVYEDYDSEMDILIRKDLPSNNTLSFAEKESFHFDIPPFSRPPAKPPDGDIGILNIKMMGDISDQRAFMHKLMITLASHQETSPDLLSHRCETIKKFNTHRSHLNICPMMIHGQNNPPLDVL
nr:hypothetical protein [Tanacetum cinerariifolium]